MEQNDGSGWSPVTGALHHTHILDNSPGTNGAMTSDTCFTTGTVDGICYVTIVSPTAGTTTIHAQVSFEVGGVPLSPQTEPDGVVTWVNAGISIADIEGLRSPTNEVDNAHTFVVTVKADSSGGHPNFQSITASVNPDQLLQNDNTCGSPTVVDTYTRTCTITINSSVPGVFTIKAAAEVKIKGVTLVLATGDHGGFPNATKTYVDARISVAPDGVNPVGAEHTFTILVQQHDGISWGPATAVFPTYSLDNSPGATVMDNETCSAGTGTTGECTVKVQSSTTGTTTINAEVSLTMGGGVTLSRQTQTDAVATWVSADISIAESATNAVRDAHTFTVTVSADSSGGLPNFMSISAAVTNDPDLQNDNTCGTPDEVQLDPYTRSCTITINSSAAGVFVASAEAVVEIGGITFNLATGDQSEFPNATKTYVDARISVAPDGVYQVGAEHTFTILVQQHDGISWGPAIGVFPTYSLDNSPGATVMDNETCSTGTGTTGECTVRVQSSTTGTTTINAEVSLTMDGGVTLSRQTQTDAVATWVSADISIAESATNAVRDAHTFTVTVSADSSGGLPNFMSISAAVTNDPDLQNDNTCGTPDEVQVDPYTRSCTITINSSAAGVFVASAEAVVEIGGITFNLATDDQSEFPNATKTYVDARISVAPDGVYQVGAEHTFTILVEQHDGTGWGPAIGVFPTYTLTDPDGAIANYTCTGGTDANGECTVTVTSSTAGTTTIHAEIGFEVDGAALSRQTRPDAVATWVSPALVLQRQFREGCGVMPAWRRGAWHGSVWPVRYCPAYPQATAATRLARTVPGAAFPAPPGRPAAS